MSLISAQTVERLKAEVGTLQPMGEIWATARFCKQNSTGHATHICLLLSVAVSVFQWQS